MSGIAVRQKRSVHSGPSNTVSHTKPRRYGIRRRIYAWSTRDRCNHLFAGQKQPHAPARQQRPLSGHAPRWGCSSSKPTSSCPSLCPTKRFTVATDCRQRHAHDRQETQCTPTANAVSPQTTRQIEAIITDAGWALCGRRHHRRLANSRRAPHAFYVSPASTPHVVSEIDGKGIIVKPLGDQIGRGVPASRCATPAPHQRHFKPFMWALLAAAESLNLTDDLVAEFPV